MEKNCKSKFLTLAPRVISVAFHPLFIPLYGLLLIFFAPTLFWYLPFRIKQILFFIVLINNVMIPVSMIPFFRNRNIIKSWSFERREERTIPLITVTVLYAVTSLIFFRMELPVFIKAYIYSLTLLLAVLLIANLAWKVSFHSAGAGALVALVLVLSVKMSASIPLYIALSLIVSGAVLSSRLKLNIQNPLGVYSGFLTGFTVLGFLMFMFQ